jgi:hypothetical protein
MKKINAVESHKLHINCLHCDSLCQSIFLAGITHFVENYFVKIHKDDRKNVVDHFIKTTYGVKNSKPFRGTPEVLGD